MAFRESDDIVAWLSSHAYVPLRKQRVGLRRLTWWLGATLIVLCFTAVVFRGMLRPVPILGQIVESRIALLSILACGVASMLTCLCTWLAVGAPSESSDQITAERALCTVMAGILGFCLMLVAALTAFLLTLGPLT